MRAWVRQPSYGPHAAEDSRQDARRCLSQNLRFDHQRSPQVPPPTHTRGLSSAGHSPALQQPMFGQRRCKAGFPGLRKAKPLAIEWKKFSLHAFGAATLCCFKPTPITSIPQQTSCVLFAKRNYRYSNTRCGGTQAWRNKAEHFWKPLSTPQGPFHRPWKGADGRMGHPRVDLRPRGPTNNNVQLHAQAGRTPVCNP